MKTITLAAIGLAFIVLPATAFAAAPLITGTNATNITTTTVDLAGQIDSNGSANVRAWYEFDAGDYGAQTITGNPGIVNLSSYTLTGLTPGTNYSFRVSAINNLGQLTNGSPFSFTTLSSISAPTIVSTTYSGVGTDRATLEGVINPNNASRVRVWFELSGADYGAQSITTGGASNVTLAPTTVTGLSPSTTYSFRIAAINNLGQLTNGATVSFLTSGGGGGGGATPPSIVSANATFVGTDRVTLNGIVNPNGYTTQSWFEFNGADYGSQNLGAGSSDVTMIPFVLTGLTPATNYSFRVSAINSSGQLTNGINVSFTTAASNPVPTLTGLSPAAGTQGQTLGVALTGTDFISSASSVDFGAGITINSTTINSSTSITANIMISSSATVGARNVTITNSAPGGGTSSAQIFTINAAAVITPPGGGGGGGVILTPSNNSNSSASSSSAPIAATSLATFITSNSAKLGGVADINGTAATTAYFEYGKTASLGGTTASQSVGSNGVTDFSATVENLNPDTIYYFRAVVTNQYGTARGSIRIFKTLNSAGVATSDENELENIAAEANANTEGKGAPSGENENAEGETISVNDIPEKSLLAAVAAGARDLAPRNMAEWLFLASVTLGLVLLARHLFFVVA